MRIFLLTVGIVCCSRGFTQVSSKSGPFREDFNDSLLHNFQYGSTGIPSHGKWNVGAASPTEPHTNVLLFAIDPDDSAGPGRGPEIISKDFTHFGTYSARLQVPHIAGIQPNVGAVVGYFTYHMDSIAGLSEIDFEWLVADPTILYIGTWTGADNHHLKRIGRTINLAKGIIYTTEYKEGYDGESVPLTGIQNNPEKIIAVDGYDASIKFYTYGFDWYPDRLRWWMMDAASNKKIILWDYRGSLTGIPQHPTQYRMNFWHTDNWPVESNPNAIERPQHAFELQVDWMDYQPMKNQP